jgi:hypothetical protein
MHDYFKRKKSRMVIHHIQHINAAVFRYHVLTAYLAFSTGELCSSSLCLIMITDESDFVNMFLYIFLSFQLLHNCLNYDTLRIYFKSRGYVLEE